MALMTEKERKKIAGSLPRNTAYESKLLEQRRKELYSTPYIPKKTTVEPKKEGVVFKQSSLAEDGFTFGEKAQAVGATISDLGFSILKGIFRVGEGIADLGTYTVAGIADIFGADDWANKQREYAEQNTTDEILFDTREMSKMFTDKPMTTNTFDLLKEQSFAGTGTRQVAEGVGYVGGMVGTGYLLGGASASGGLSQINAGKTAATVASKVGVRLTPKAASAISKFSIPTASLLSASGNAMSQAYNEGATDGEAFVYGLLSGTVEGMVEGLGGISSIKMKALGKGATDPLKKSLVDKVKSNVGKALATAGIEFFDEGLEEVISSVLNPYLQRITYNKNAENVSADELFNEFLMGGIVAAVLGMPSVMSAMKKSSKTNASTTIDTASNTETKKYETTDTVDGIETKKDKPTDVKNAEDLYIKGDAIAVKARIEYLEDKISTLDNPKNIDIKGIGEELVALRAEYKDLIKQTTVETQEEELEQLSLELDTLEAMPEEAKTPVVIEKMAAKKTEQQEIIENLDKDKPIKTHYNRQFILDTKELLFVEAQTIVDSMNTKRVTEKPLEIQPETEYDETQQRIADVAAAFKKQVVFLKNADFGGMVPLENENIIFIGDNINNDLILSNNQVDKMTYALGHEMFHSLKMSYPEIFNEFTDFIKTDVTEEQLIKFMEKYDPTDEAGLLKALQIDGKFDIDAVKADNKKYNTQNKALNYIVEEMVANEFGGMITDKKYMTDLNAKNPGLFTKIVKALKELFSVVDAPIYSSPLTQLQVTKIRKDFEFLSTFLAENIETKVETKKEVVKQEEPTVDLTQENPFGLKQEVKKEPIVAKKEVIKQEVKKQTLPKKENIVKKETVKEEDSLTKLPDFKKKFNNKAEIEKEIVTLKEQFDKVGFEMLKSDMDAENFNLELIDDPAILKETKDKNKKEYDALSDLFDALDKRIVELEKEIAKPEVKKPLPKKEVVKKDDVVYQSLSTKIEEKIKESEQRLTENTKTTAMSLDSRYEFLQKNYQRYVDEKSPVKKKVILEATQKAYDNYKKDGGTKVVVGLENNKMLPSKEQYAMSHRPSEGPQAFDLLQTNDDVSGPKDIYENPQYYTGTLNKQELQETMSVLNKAKGNPNATITIYRATPGNQINNGDWITLSKSYAKQHNESQFDGKGNVLELKVRAKDIRWAMDDLSEWGYFPENNKMLSSKPTKDENSQKYAQRWEELKQKYSDAEIQEGKYESIVRYDATSEDEGGGKYNDTTQDELNAMPTKFITYKPSRTEYIYKNRNEMMNDIQKSYGGFSQFGDQYTIASASGIGEYYLYRDRYTKSQWVWKDVNDNTVTGREWREIRYLPSNLTKDDKTTGISEFVTNTMEKSPAFDFLRNEVRKDPGFGQYEKLSEDVVKAKTEELIKNKLDETFDKIHKGTEVLNPMEQQIAATMINEYDKRGDIDSAMALTKLLQSGTVTPAAQALQAVERFQKNPYYIVNDFINMVDKMNEEFMNSNDRTIKNWLKEHAKGVELTAGDTQYILQMAKKLENLDENSHEYAQRWALINTFIANKMPKEFWTKVKNFRRMGFLFNPKTIIRNWAGNVMMEPIYDVADMFGAKIDDAVSKKFGTLGTTDKVDRKIRRLAKKEGVESVIQDYKLGITTDLNNPREVALGQTFNPDTMIGKGLNSLERLTNAAMALGDRGHESGHYLNTLTTLMKKHGVETATESMIQLAKDVAAKRTWKNNGKMVKAAGQIRSLFNQIGIKDGKFGIQEHGSEVSLGLGDIILPFIMTPANLLVATYDFSPLAAISAVKNWNTLKETIKKGGDTITAQKNFVDSTSKAMTGTLLFIIAGALAKMGVITGGEDEDKDKRELDKILGNQPYSVKIGDMSFTYDWAQPLSNIFATMGELERQTNIKSDTQKMNFVKMVGEAFTVGGDRLVEQSFLQNIRTLLGGGYNDSSLGERFIDLTADIPPSMVPTLFKQFADFLDGDIKSTYDKNSPLQTMIAKTMARIPIVKSALPTKKDVLGNNLKYYSNIGEGVITSFLSPMNIKRDVAGELGDEITDVFNHTGDKTIIPQVAVKYIDYDGDGDGKAERYDFNPSQQSQLQETMGKIVSESFGGMFVNDIYMNATYDEKAKSLTALMEYAKGKALEDSGLVPNYKSGNDNLVQIKKYMDAGLDVANSIMYRGIISPMKGDKDAEGKTIEGTTQGKKAFTIMNMQTSDAAKDIMLDLITDGKTHETTTSLSKLSTQQQFIDYYSLNRSDLMMMKKFSRDDYDIATSKFNIDGKQFMKAVGGLSEIKSDVDAKGNTIENSKKKKVTTYINSLPLNQIQKIYLYGTAGYSIKQWRNEMYTYINGLNITAEEKKNLWEQLGLK